MTLQESGEMYLETIYVLTKEKGSGVRAVDVSEQMGYSKPSVSRAVGLLKQGGYLEVTSGGYLVLTDEGLAVAEKTYEYHRVLSDFFTKIGVDKETAVSDACRIEHCISDETFAAIKEHLKSL